MSTTGKHSPIEDGTNNPKLETNSRRPPADVAAEAASQRCRSQTPALGIAPGKIARRQCWRTSEMDRPLRTLLYELVLEPILRVLQRVLDSVF
jgi:hypothetical protein